MSGLFGLLRESRKRFGFNQQDLAHRAGISLATLQNIEAGKANPALNTLQSLLDELGLEMSVQPRQINWPLLVFLGVPLLASDSSKELLFTPARQDLIRTLTNNALALQALSPGSREREAVGNLLLAIKDHYPGIWALLGKHFDDYQFTVSPKLRRLALARLSEYL